MVKTHILKKRRERIPRTKLQLYSLLEKWNKSVYYNILNKREKNICLISTEAILNHILKSYM
jgi:hypothetical protein